MSEIRTPLSTVFAAAARTTQRVLHGESLETAMDYEDVEAFAPQSRAAFRDYCMGTLREWRSLEWLAQQSAARTQFAPQVLGALFNVALYALRRTKVAPHVIVSQAVAACEELDALPAKGLLNGALRGFQRRAEELERTLTKQSPAVQWSYPDWWIARLKSDWPQQWQHIAQAGNRKPPMALRVNTQKIARDDYLQQCGHEAVAFGRAGVMLNRPIPAAQLYGFSGGLVSIQDGGAQLCADALEVKDGMRVLDACSAPGGKSAALLERAMIELVAVDRDALRQNTTREGLTRLGLKAEVKVADVAHLPSWWDKQPFDRILFDAPCTASGVVRRHPDGKWLKRETDLTNLVALQADLLRNLWKTLKPGGSLAYITCSVFRDENDRQIERFLSANADSKLRSVVWPEGVVAYGMGQLLPAGAPTTHNHDGFFCVLLDKAAR
jgi:16S rRNA (cytosine967-C5)-methyltransferase